MTSLKEEHDQLLAEKPEGAEHDTDTCVFCNEHTNTASTDETQQGGDMKTYTEEDLNAAVNEAVAPILAELTKIKEERNLDETEEKIAAAKAEVEAEAQAKIVELEGQLAALQTQLDATELRANDSEAASANLLAWLESEAQAAEEAALTESRKEARVQAVSEVATFTEDQIASKVDRWVAMDDEAFEAYLEDIKAVAVPATAAHVLTEVPAETAMNHSTRAKASNSAVGDLFELMKQGIDPRTNHMKGG